MTKTGNEPAYPQESYMARTFIDDEYRENVKISVPGMTIRQRFVLAAMQGILTNPHSTRNKTILSDAVALSVDAVKYADACLIREIETREGK